MTELPSQSEFGFESGAGEAGYVRWVEVRREAAEALAQRLNLPLNHEVEAWLRGGVRLRGKLTLVDEVLFVEDNRLRDLTLKVDGVAFKHPEMESCVRLD